MRRRVHFHSRWLAPCAFGVVTALAATGCQVDVGGQTLPSAYYQKDDIQYFAPGPEFKLAKEAAALEELAEEQAVEER